MKKVVRTFSLLAILLTPVLVSQQCAEFFCLLNPGSIFCGIDREEEEPPQ